MKTLPRLAALFSVLLLLVTGVAAADPPEGGPTPPRLSLIEGEVSFWRPGAEEWTAARLNTPLAAGDALYAGDKSNLEVQIGNRAFVRAADETELSLVSRDPDYLQFKIAQGKAAFDVRVLPAGTTIEVDTPNAAFAIDRAGYYRLNVDQDTTRFVTRRGGAATVVAAGGEARNLAASEEALVEGIDAPDLRTDAAPDADAWDRWNFARTDDLIDAASERHLPPDVYGADELDKAGRWRTVAGYGTVWVPTGLSPSWAPYSSGHWIWDPSYGWTWIDDMRWGWAPFHYGRWVFVHGFWAWAPGPRVRRTVYAPALVAFFHSERGVSVGVSAPAMSWVALSWGEPVLPWWGPAGFVGVPWWGGWGGPRVVNKVVVRPRTVVNVSHITFQNTHVHNAVTVVHRDHFGHRPVRRDKHRAPDHRARESLTPVAGPLPVRPSPASLVAGPASRVQPRGETFARPVVSLRPPRETRQPWRAPMNRSASEAAPVPLSPGEARERRVVSPPAQIPTLPQATPSSVPGERERSTSPRAPRFDDERRRALPPNTAKSRADPPQVAPPPAAPSQAVPSQAVPSQAGVPQTLPPQAVPPERRFRGETRRTSPAAVGSDPSDQIRARREGAPLGQRPPPMRPERSPTLPRQVEVAPPPQPGAPLEQSGRPDRPRNEARRAMPGAPDGASEPRRQGAPRPPVPAQAPEALRAVTQPSAPIPSLRPVAPESRRPDRRQDEPRRTAPGASDDPRERLNPRREVAPRPPVPTHEAQGQRTTTRQGEVISPSRRPAAPSQESGRRERRHDEERGQPPGEPASRGTRKAPPGANGPGQQGANAPRQPFGDNERGGRRPGANANRDRP